jgi:hypothetical protein
MELFLVIKIMIVKIPLAANVDMLTTKLKKLSINIK